MTRPLPFASLSNTPLAVDGGRAGQLQTVFARNPHSTDGAYVKLYASAAAPTGSSVPLLAVWVAGGESKPIPMFVDGAQLWLAVATEAAAGLSAPTSAFVCAATFERASG